jgi:hypothetical protein
MRRRYNREHDYETLDSEDYTLLDPEAEAKYENVNPGTVTVEGFGYECWDFEMLRPRDKTILVSHSKMPNIPAAKLLRRIDELRRASNRMGWDPDGEEFDIQ